MSITMTIEIPALDRLCDLIDAGKISPRWAENAGRDVPAEGGQQAAEAPKAADTAATAEAGGSEAEQGPAAKEQAAPEEIAPAEESAPKEEPPKVTMDAVQRAAVQLRDEGMLGRVTAMFPEFGIKKISDLKGDALEAFAGRLRELGAKV